MNALDKINPSVYLETLFNPGLRIVLIAVLMLLAARFLRLVLRRLKQQIVQRGQAVGEVPSEAQKRAETLIALLYSAAQIVLGLTAGLMILRELGVEIAPILASAGIVGIAVGFGAQNLVKDIIAGFFMTLENHVRVGDVVMLNGTTGQVERMNLRTLILRDTEGRVHIFRAGAIETLTNLTREWSAYVFEVGVAYQEDTDRVVEIMRRVGAELRADALLGAAIIADIEVFGVERFDASAVIIKGRIKTLPMRQWDVGREFLRRVKKAFDHAQVDFPLPRHSFEISAANTPLKVLLTDARE